MEFTLLAAALTGVVALWLVLRLTGASSALDLAVTAAVVGMLTGRLTAMALAGINPFTDPLDVLLVRGGVNTAGATIGAVAYLIWATRRERDLLTQMGPAATAGLAGWHAGCLWREACLGTAADVPWGWSLAGSEVVRHPVELYTAALMMAATLVLVRREGRGGAGLALMATAGARLLTEPLRPSLGTGRVWWYAAGAAVGLTWAVMGDSVFEHAPVRRDSPG